MLAKTWTVVASDGPHVIGVQHGRWLSRRTVTVDGQPVPTQSVHRRLSETIVERFPVGAATGVLTIEPRGFTQWHHALSVDDTEVVPRLPSVPMPAWVWLPVAACFGPFVLALLQHAPPLAAAVAGLMGGGGAVAAFAVARDPATSVLGRQVRCAALAGFVWTVQFLPALAMAAVFAALQRTG